MGDGQPETAVYSDHRVPFDQLGGLYLLVEGLTWVEFATYQVDDEWGLHVSNQPLGFEELSGDRRGQRSSEPAAGLACGFVNDVEIRVEDERIVSEVLLVIGERPILLVAAEVDEGPDGELGFFRNDESIFVITSTEQMAGWAFTDGEGPRLRPSFDEVANRG